MRLKWSATLSPLTRAGAIQVYQRDTASHFATDGLYIYRVAQFADGFELWQTQVAARNTPWLRLGRITGLDNPAVAVYAAQGLVWVFCERSLHILAGQGADLQQDRSGLSWNDPNAGRAGTVWGGNVWASIQRSLFRYYSDQGVLATDTRFGPGSNVLNDSPVSGCITALAGDSDGLWATVRNEDDALSWLIQLDQNTGAWHVLSKLGDFTIHAMTISRVGDDTNSILWLAGNGRTFASKLPLDGNPLTDEGYDFHVPVAGAPSVVHLGEITTLWPQQEKVWSWLDVQVREGTVAVRARVDRRDWDQALSVGPFQAESDPINTPLTGRALWLSVNLISSPVVERVFVGNTVRYRGRRLIQAAVKLSGTAQGGWLPTGDNLGIMANLRALKSAARVVDLVSPIGERIPVLVIGATAAQTEAVTGEDAEWIVAVEMVEQVSFA